MVEIEVLADRRRLGVLGEIRMMPKLLAKQYIDAGCARYTEQKATKEQKNGIVKGRNSSGK